MIPVIELPEIVRVPPARLWVIRNISLGATYSVMMSQLKVNLESETVPEMVPLSLTTKAAIRELVPVTSEPDCVSIHVVVWS